VECSTFFIEYSQWQSSLIEFGILFRESKLYDGSSLTYFSPIGDYNDTYYPDTPAFVTPPVINNPKVLAYHNIGPDNVLAQIDMLTTSGYGGFNMDFGDTWIGGGLNRTGFSRITTEQYDEWSGIVNEVVSSHPTLDIFVRCNGNVLNLRGADAHAGDPTTQGDWKYDVWNDTEVGWINQTLINIAQFIKDHKMKGIWFDMEAYDWE
jgi:hypothetical protein